MVTLHSAVYILSREDVFYMLYMIPKKGPRVNIQSITMATVIKKPQTANGGVSEANLL